MIGHTNIHTCQSWMFKPVKEYELLGISELLVISASATTSARVATSSCISSPSSETGLALGAVDECSVESGSGVASALKVSVLSKV